MKWLFIRDFHWINGRYSTCHIISSARLVSVLCKFEIGCFIIWEKLVSSIFVFKKSIFSSLIKIKNWHFERLNSTWTLNWMFMHEKLLKKAIKNQIRVKKFEFLGNQTIFIFFRPTVCWISLCIPFLMGTVYNIFNAFIILLSNYFNICSFHLLYMKLGCHSFYTSYH